MAISTERGPYPVAPFSSFDQTSTQARAVSDCVGFTILRTRQAPHANNRLPAAVQTAPVPDPRLLTGQLRSILNVQVTYGEVCFDAPPNVSVDVGLNSDVSLRHELDLMDFLPAESCRLLSQIDKERGYRKDCRTRRRTTPSIIARTLTRGAQMNGSVLSSSRSAAEIVVL